MPLIFCLATPVAAVVINGRTDPAATCDTIKVFGRKLDESARTRSAYSPTSASVDLEFLGPKLHSGHFLTVLGRTDVGKGERLHLWGRRISTFLVHSPKDQMPNYWHI